MTDETIKRFVDAAVTEIWEKIEPEFRSAVRLKLMDTLLRSGKNIVEGHLNHLTDETIKAANKTITDDPVYQKLMNRFAHRATAKRVRIKLIKYGINPNLLTESEKAWLAKNGYDITGAEPNNESNGSQS